MLPKETIMSKTLVAYFSASGQTARLAGTLARTLGADLYEIVPARKYTKADLNWNDAESRSSVEMKDPASRPAIAGSLPDMSQYETVFVGFPIWWYTAPHIILTFLESADFAGKTCVAFVTSGSSGMGGTDEDLKKVCPAARWLRGERLSSRATEAEVRGWVQSLGL